VRPVHIIGTGPAVRSFRTDSSAGSAADIERLPDSVEPTALEHWVADLREQLPQLRYVTVFGSATPEGSDDAAWHSVGANLHEFGAGVMTGGYAGAMELVAQSAARAGGVSVGIRAAGLMDPSDPEAYSHVVELPDVFVRLQALLLLGDAFIVLPGGIGTMVELTSLLWQVARQFMPPKPVFLVGDHWTQFVALLERDPMAFRSSAAMVLSMLTPVDQPAELVAKLRSALT